MHARHPILEYDTLVVANVERTFAMSLVQSGRLKNSRSAV